MTAPAPRNHPAEDAHPAPTPAPVAMPEGGWREGDQVRLVRGKRTQWIHRSHRDEWVGEDGLVHADDAMVARNLATGRDAYSRITAVHAPRENARPEPVVAPLPSEAVEAARNALTRLSHEVIESTQRTGASTQAALADVEVIEDALHLVLGDDEDTVRAVDALSVAREQISARRIHFRELGADDQYLNALEDAFGLVSNLWRSHGGEGR